MPSPLLAATLVLARIFSQNDVLVLLHRKLPGTYALRVDTQLYVCPWELRKGTSKRILTASLGALGELAVCLRGGVVKCSDPPPSAACWCYA
jgi:hypothetical protein